MKKDTKQQIRTFAQLEDALDEDYKRLMSDCENLRHHHDFEERNKYLSAFQKHLQRLEKMKPGCG
ncbi:MAG: hypothetical protein OHK0053_28650 [Microscillaceae bacterium]